MRVALVSSGRFTHADRTPLDLFCRARCIAAIAAAAAAPLPAAADAAPPRPNVIMILADDLGYGDVGFNGQTKIQTPHLDALAAASLRYDLAYCPAAVCTPTRAAMLMGLHNGHTFVDSNANLPKSTATDVGFRSTDQTVGDTLQAAGYQTAVFGKWGFGGDEFTHTPSIVEPNSLPNNLGFDEFYGYLNHRRAHDYFIPTLWQTDGSAPNGVSTVATGGVYTHDLVAAQTEQYIEDHAGDAQPFFQLVEYTIPHFDLDQIAQVPGGLDLYAGEPWTDKQKKYASMITRMDASIGSLLDRLDDPNDDGDTSDSIRDNTLVIFASDNGATAEDSAPIDFFDSSGGLRGGKRDLWDGGVRTPLLFHWQNTIAPGVDTTTEVDLTDILPTLADLAGVDATAGLDGVSLAPTLTGQGIQRDKPYLIFEHHETDGPDPDSRDARWAILRDRIKLIKFSNGDYELYDLAADPDENAPLNLGDPTHAALRAELEAIALAEGVAQGNSDYAIYPQWTAGGDDATLGDADNWGQATGPAATWLATLENTTGSDRTVDVAASAAVLGLEVRGSGAGQTLVVGQGRTLTARNELRIAAGGTVQLEGGQVDTVRWVDIHAGGALAGTGGVSGIVYNLGRIAPGVDNAAPPAPGPTPPVGIVNAITFDFTGVQDDAPLTATSTLDPAINLVAGLDLGGGIAVKHPGGDPNEGTNAGDEFNVFGFETSSLAGAIGAADFLGYTVEAVAGLAVHPDTITFDVWRNGNNAATDYAVLTSIDDFADTESLGGLTIANRSDTSTYTVTGAYAGSAVTGPVDVRLYGWNGISGGNTHLTAAAMTAEFETVAGTTLGPTGTLAITGDLYHLTDAVLEMQIDQLANPDGDDNDRIDATGVVDLAGLLELALGEPGGVAEGDRFTLMTAAAITGEFQRIDGVALGDGRGLAVRVLSDRVEVEVARMGDITLTGGVDVADLTVLASNWKQVGRTWSQGDLNGDTRVDAFDLDLMRINWNAAPNASFPEALASVAFVPEPGSLGPMMLLISLLLRRSSRAADGFLASSTT